MQDAGTPIEGSFQPLNSAATPAQPGAGGAPATAPTGTMPAATGEVHGEAGAPVEGSFQPVGSAGAEDAKPNLPNGEMRAGGSPSLMEAVKSADAGGMLKLWAQNVSNDIKYGSDVTGIGTLLKRMGAHGVYMGSPEKVADIIAGLPLGLLQAGGGLADMHNHPVQGAEDVLSGGLQAATVPGAFMAPELSEEGAAAMGKGADAIGAGAKRVVGAFTEPRTAPESAIDSAAIKAAAQRGVQPKMMSGLRSMMKSLETDAGIVKPAGSPPEAPIEQQSIRDAVKKTSDAFIARAKSLYASLDEATGGQFQRFETQLKEVNQQLAQLVNTPDEESMASEAALDAKRASIEEARDAAFDRAKEKGVDPNLIENARADFKRGQALKDLDYNVKKVASGARPSPKMQPADMAKDPELLHPERWQKRLDVMYDSGRLQEAVGNENADRMIADASKHKVQVQQSTREALDRAQQSANTTREAAARRIAQNSAIRKGVYAGAGALAARTPLGESAVKAATHIFLPGVGVTPAP